MSRLGFTVQILVQGAGLSVSTDAVRDGGTDAISHTNVLSLAGDVEGDRELLAPPIRYGYPAALHVHPTPYREYDYYQRDSNSSSSYYPERQTPQLSTLDNQP